MTHRCVIYDLHSHTQVSDGILTPTALVHRAHEMGVDVLAITDHDTTSGLEEAEQAIIEQQLPLQLIAGVEISTQWLGFEIHIVGLNVVPDSMLLCSLLTRQRQQRTIRAEAMADNLAKHNIPNVLTGVRQLAGDATLTRGHFARYLVEIGIASSPSQVFKKFLSKGKPGYVASNWCTIDEAVEVVQGAGGQAVLAHPARYGLSAKWLRRLLIDFKQAGGDAVEVAQCQQAPNERSQLAKYAQEYQLLASLGSDFHYPCPWLELGRDLWLPENVTPIWATWAR